MTSPKCCGCCSLKTGVMIIAILSLVHSCSSFFGCVFFATHGAKIKDYSTDHVRERDLTPVYTYMLIPTSINLVVALCFIYGVTKERKYFILPYLVLGLISIVISTIAVLVLAILVHPALLLLYILVAVAVYLWYCVLCYYKHLADRGVVLPYSTMEMDRNNLVGKA